MIKPIFGTMKVTSPKEIIKRILKRKKRFIRRYILLERRVKKW